MARGFGLLAVLVSLLIVGLLAAVGLQRYFQASLDPLVGATPTNSASPEQAARLAEAQALTGRTMAALTLCARTKGAAARMTGGSGGCSLVEVAASAGVGVNGATADGRWQVTVAEVSMSGEPALPRGQVSVADVGGNAAGLSTSLFATPAGMVARCAAGGAPPPSSPSAGQGC